ncbi:uncharacterized protein LOC109704934 [Ananas comosus]|uniref:ubiquitinyl hydrolase 1 n=1 Tax=Ananas comosus TaxID=4615 RepID=A0A6P5EIC8_ANACO|nr:uncharacterized protein LOC109704934 [Ananas comosus]
MACAQRAARVACAARKESAARVPPACSARGQQGTGSPRGPRPALQSVARVARVARKGCAARVARGLRPAHTARVAHGLRPAPFFFFFQIGDLHHELEPLQEIGIFGDFTLNPLLRAISHLDLHTIPRSGEERERDHFSQFITKGFTSYCKRKRRDKVYGNNVEIQAFAEMYNHPIHIYSYSTKPVNIFQGSDHTDTPPIQLSYHYNSLVDPRRLTIGAGLGFSSLRGANIDKDQVKAAIKAQQNQQIDNISFYSFSLSLVLVLNFFC